MSDLIRELDEELLQWPETGPLPPRGFGLLANSNPDPGRGSVKAASPERLGSALGISLCSKQGDEHAEC